MFVKIHCSVIVLSLKMGCIFHRDALEDSYVDVDAYTGDKNLCGMRHGYGTFCYNNGDVYRGTWRWNKREGYGDYLYADGKRLSGFWLADQYIGNIVEPHHDYGTQPLDSHGHPIESDAEKRKRLNREREERKARREANRSEAYKAILAKYTRQQEGMKYNN